VVHQAAIAAHTRRCIVVRLGWPGPRGLVDEGGAFGSTGRSGGGLPIAAYPLAKVTTELEAPGMSGGRTVRSGRRRHTIPIKTN